MQKRGQITDLRLVFKCKRTFAERDDKEPPDEERPGKDHSIYKTDYSTKIKVSLKHRAEEGEGLGVSETWDP